MIDQGKSGKPLTFGGVCAGILGFELGLTQAGLEPRWVAEIDLKCSALIAERAPGIPNYGDIRGVSFRYGKGWKRYRHPEPVDVMVGGFPCQDVSVAGKRKGLAGSRSGLWFEFLRLITEARPQWAVIENVPGLLSSNGGRDFAVILQGLAQIGYSTAWRILDAQYDGVAQRRRRVFIVASLGDGRCAQVLFERESLSWDTAPSRETGTFTSALTANGVGVRGADDNQAQARHLVANSLATIRGVDRGDKELGWYTRGMGATERDETDRVITNALTASMGNYSSPDPATGKGTPIVVAHPLASHHGRDSGEDNFIPVVGALSAHSTRHGHAMTTQQAAESGQLIPAPVIVWDNGQGDPNSEESHASYALNAQANQGVLAFQSWASAASSMNPAEIAPALDVGKAGGMAVAWHENQQGELTPDKDGIAKALRAGASHSYQGVGVRRLTPTECEILQGFYPGWTDNGQSDSARYRQLGNAVCVPVARWIGQQLMRVHEATQ